MKGTAGNFAFGEAGNFNCSMDIPLSNVMKEKSEEGGEEDIAISSKEYED